MIDWSLPPDLQKKYDEVVERTRRIQRELGIKPMTLEERAIAAEKRREEIARLQQIVKSHRPPPKWKL